VSRRKPPADVAPDPVGVAGDVQDSAAPSLSGVLRGKLTLDALNKITMPKMPLATLMPDRRAQHVVPRKGFTARLTVFAAATMAFLAVFALALAFASGRMAERWGAELARTATVRISAPAEAQAQQTEAALAALAQTPGIASARALSAEESLALLEPWLGSDLNIEDLPVPQLIEIVEDGAGYDEDGLRLRLAAEAPGAVLDNHSSWRQPLVSAAWRLRAVALFAVVLITLAMTAVIILAANAALSANAQVIRVLRLVGARDAFIAGAFVRRFTLRALIGSAAGALAGGIAVALMPATESAGGFLTGLRFQGWDWLLLIIVPLVAAAISYLATRAAALQVLRSLP
jgi:cell division transport system permease protein